MPPTLEEVLSAVAQKTYSPNGALNKLVEVNRNQGNKGLQNEQATSRVIYDSLPLTAVNTNFRFFEGCGSRQFPRTNLTQNRLEVNESAVFMFLSFHIVTYSAAGALPVVSVEPLSTTFAGMYRSDYSVEISNQQVIKATPLDTSVANFNRYAKHTTHESIKMMTNLVLTSLTEFVVILRNTNATTSTTKEIMCMLEGPGTLNQVKGTY